MNTLDLLNLISTGIYDKLSSYESAADNLSVLSGIQPFSTNTPTNVASFQPLLEPGADCSLRNINNNSTSESALSLQKDSMMALLGTVGYSNLLRTFRDANLAVAANF